MGYYDIQTLFGQENEQVGAGEGGISLKKKKKIQFFPSVFGTGTHRTIICRARWNADGTLNVIMHR
jgi:hypothetical protein